MKKIKLKLKLNPQKISYYFYFATAIIAFLILVFVSFFLYKNFYQIITQSEAIMILQEKVAFETVDMENFNKIIEKVENKTKPREHKNIINPFE